MDIKSLIKMKLHEIHRSRSRVGILPTLLLISAAIYFQKEKLFLSSTWIYVCLIMVMGLGIRSLLSGPYFKSWSEGNKGLRFLGHFSFFLIGLGWGIHFLDVCEHYGLTSSNAYNTLLILMAYITSISLTLAASRISYYVFLGTLSSFTLLPYILEINPGLYQIIGYIVIYNIFSVINYRLSSQQLHSLIQTQIQSELEKNRLENIINTVPGHVFLYDQNLVCYLANKSALEMIPGLIGKKVGSIDATSDWEEFIKTFNESGKASDVKEGFSRITGRDMWCLLNIQRTMDNGIIMVWIDTTELIVAQKTIRAQEAKAQYTAKLASLGEMAAGIAHEVNNPLTIIQGASRVINTLIITEPIDREMVTTLNNKIIGTTDRISKIVKSLKTLARNGEDDPMTKVKIKTIIDSCLDVCGLRFKNNNVDLRLSGNIEEEILGQEVQLGQVMLNLLGNALDAVKEVDDRWVEIKIESINERWLDLIIKDSGKGIPKHIQDKIMEPFFTTKDVNQGTGLGLSISKSIMQNHKGELSLLTDESFTTFRMRLPKI